MTDTDRRSVLKGILGGAAVAAAGFAIMADEAEAVPLAMDKTGAAEIDDLVENAQVVVVRPRRRRVCWWRGRRRVCAWR